MTHTPIAFSYRRRDSKLDDVAASTGHRELSRDDASTTTAEVRERPSDVDAIGPAIGPTETPAATLSTMTTTTTTDPVEAALELGVRALAEAITRARAEDLPQLADRLAEVSRGLEARRLARASNVVAMPIPGTRLGRP